MMFSAVLLGAIGGPALLLSAAGTVICLVVYKKWGTVAGLSFCFLLLFLSPLLIIESLMCIIILMPHNLLNSSFCSPTIHPI